MELSYYQRHKEEIQAYQKRYRAEHPERRAATVLKSYPKQKEWILKNNRLHPEEVANRNLKYNYGITLDQKNQMVEEQNGLCGACKDVLGEDPRNICVDHDHKTGRVRKILCYPCNLALGGMKEDSKRIYRLSRYAKWCNTL